MQEKNTNLVNFKSLREQSGMTLSQLSELSGYSIASINGLELNDIGSKRLRDRILSILLQKTEEGDKTEIQHWRDRALRAEEKLNQLKSAMQGWLKKNLAHLFTGEQLPLKYKYLLLIVNAEKTCLT